ncbi:Sm-like ribonucleo protein [Acaromyces ingoldii]|uniref:Sm protein B n=1 Tax=Acaromyces ingoldii TaxID=215250 RepID=A0A316YXU9_9BASI|nr:Sm-like ribonucleo protein [Acaromyces ingoldii]PWN93458.1 Sm-like ribonucleo protein [Acaromyces ingoldii]
MPPATGKGSKMMSLINYRLRITLNDGRQMTGQMLAFDQHMNLVMADTEEFRRLKSKSKKRKAKADEGSDEDDAVPVPETEQKRTLGLIILRGESVVSLSVEGPPPADKSGSQPGLAAGPGRGAPAGRGMGMAPPGVPPPTMMGRPVPFGRPPPPMGAPPGMPGGPPPGFPARPPPGFGPPPGFPQGQPQFRPPPGYPMPPRPQ